MKLEEKAHPTCMDYSAQLAQRARNSPWQCIDCKTCSLCSDSGDPDAMLFCDACDKGYHMMCHRPVIYEKPTGKWVCYQCVEELGSSTPNETNSHDYTHMNGNSSMLTPSASPEPRLNGHVSYGPIITLPRLADTLPVVVPDASDWSIDDVAQYFINVGFVQEAEIFREQEIDGKSLLLLKRGDVLTGLTFKLGPALKIYSHVQRLQTRGRQIF